MDNSTVGEPLEAVKYDKKEIEHKEQVIEESARKQCIDEEQTAQFRRFTEADADWHRAMHKKLMRKLDIHLLPLLVLMYLLNFLDRNNLSQARLSTLEKDLGMKGTDFNLATSILFVGYILMQLPSNLMLTRVRPSLYLSIAMTIWGAISTAQSAVQSFSGLLVARFFLGFAEAPFFPGAIFLMSSWYTRGEMAHRIAWFYSGSSLANAFGGLIGAGVLSNLSGVHGVSGWRWLFIIEGSITIAAAISAGFILPNYPTNTKWLTPEEQAYAQWRLLEDTGEADLADSIAIKEGVKMAFKDPRLYLFTLLQHVSILSQAFQYFFPTIAKSLGFGDVVTLLLTAPIWIVTFLVSLVATYTSGRFADRSIHITCLMLVSFVGNIIVVSTLNTGVRFFAVSDFPARHFRPGEYSPWCIIFAFYLAITDFRVSQLFLLPVGAVTSYQIILAWVANSFPRPLVKRSACISVANLIGNIANIYGSYLYADGPRYIAGGAATAGVAFLVAVLALVTRLVLQRDNKRLAQREVSESEDTAANNPEAVATGFRYIL
ncbi:allantoate permease [Ustulina deusta]|nr:allantoate permease [Ustulina deusta]